MGAPYGRRREHVGAGRLPISYVCSKCELPCALGGGAREAGEAWVRGCRTRGPRVGGSAATDEMRQSTELELAQAPRLCVWSSTHRR